ncbi:uncharacterized protein LOC142330395 [Lycorma delicatula]|uniref:uncharacterized protein LOC142330395 n=1 Tax=Lycorma delicatula TaxID=130591 RepID=UPI003F51560F
MSSGHHVHSAVPPLPTAMECDPASYPHHSHYHPPPRPPYPPRVTTGASFAPSSLPLDLVYLPSSGSVLTSAGYYPSGPNNNNNTTGMTGSVSASSSSATHQDNQDQETPMVGVCVQQQSPVASH